MTVKVKTCEKCVHCCNRGNRKRNKCCLKIPLFPLSYIREERSIIGGTAFSGKAYNYFMPVRATGWCLCGKFRKGDDFPKISEYLDS